MSLILNYMHNARVYFKTLTLKGEWQMSMVRSFASTASTL